MPINRELIPVLIKSSQMKKLDDWKQRYYKKVRNNLQVHTKGQLFKKVDTLFPNEHPASKAHCVATYEPITKSSIWKGINNLHRIFSSSSFSYQAGEDLTEWLAEYEHGGMNLLNYFLQEWVQRAIAEDPNGLFVIYPPDYAEERGMCPIQWVRSEMIQSRTAEYISFVSEIDSIVEYNYEDTVTAREVFLDDAIGGKLNAMSCTETTYNQQLQVTVKKKVIHLFTVDGFLIYSEQVKDSDNLDLTIVDFAEPVSQLPVFEGGGIIADKADILLFESFVQPFVPFGNLTLLQHRNHRAVDMQFSYPRMSELQTPCDHKGCAGGKVRCDKSEMWPDGFKPCPKCNGSGFTTVQSPYKVYQPRYDPNDANNNEHLKAKPVEFYSPDTGIITYSKDAWKDYLKMAEAAIFVSEKTYTGQVQSAESKEIDLDDLYAWLLNVSKVFYNNLRMVLQCLEDYISRNPTAVSVERPYSFAILTESEAFIALNNILMSNAPIFIKANRVDDFVSKFVSRDSPVIRALEVLKQYDPMLFYSNSEVQQFKGAGVISQEIYMKHVLGYPVMLKLYTNDKNFLFQTDEVIMKQIDAEIANYKIPAAGEALRQTVLEAISGKGAAA